MSEPQENRKRIWVFWAKASLSALLLVWLVSRADLGQISSVVRQAYYPLLIVTFLQFYLGYFFSASRWQRILRVQGAHLPLSFLIQSFMVSVFFNNFLPSTVGGDIVRVYDSWRAGGGKANALAAVFLDRTLGLTALAIYACIGLALGGDFVSGHRFVVPATLAFAAVTVSVVTLIFFVAPSKDHPWISAVVGVLPARLARVVDRFLEVGLLFKGRTDLLLIGLGFSLLLQANVIIFHFLVARCLGLPIDLLDFALIVPLALVVMMVPITVNGIGLREGVFATFFAFFGLSVAQALAFSWLIYGQILAQGLIGGLVYLFRKETIRTEGESPGSQGHGSTGKRD